MSKVKIEMNNSGMYAFFHSDEMADCLRSVAGEVAGRCGDGYETDLYNAGTRYIASVFTNSREAATDNIENNTLLKAVSR